MHFIILIGLLTSTHRRQNRLHATAITFPPNAGGTSERPIPFESTSDTREHPATRTLDCVSRPTFPGLAFKPIQKAQRPCRRTFPAGDTSPTWRLCTHA